MYKKGEGPKIYFLVGNMMTLRQSAGGRGKGGGERLERRKHGRGMKDQVLHRQVNWIRVPHSQSLTVKVKPTEP
jgi:hypothetical protein